MNKLPGKYFSFFHIHNKPKIDNGYFHGKLKMHTYVLIMLYLSDEKNKYSIPLFHLSSTIMLIF